MWIRTSPIVSFPSHDVAMRIQVTMGVEKGNEVAEEVVEDRVGVLTPQNIEKEVELPVFP